jgi:hypothetical protein
MKQTFACLALFTIALSVYSQNSIDPSGTTAKLPDNARWDLARYVWSHSHYKTGKNDKLVLDFDAIEHWYQIGSDDDLSINANGNYFAYTIKNQPYKGQTLVVQSTDANQQWSMSFVNAKPGFFSVDGKQYVFEDGRKDLCVVKVGTNDKKIIKEVASWKLSNNKNPAWLSYQLKTGDSAFVIQNLVTDEEHRFERVSGYEFNGKGERVAILHNNIAAGGLVLLNLSNGQEQRWEGVSKTAFDASGQWLVGQYKSGDLLLYNMETSEEQRFTSVSSYLIDASGKVLVLKTVNPEGNTVLKYVTLRSKQVYTVWSASNKNESINSYQFNKSGMRIAFSVKDASTNANSIWHWKPGMAASKMLANNLTPGINDGLLIQGDFYYSGDYIIFSLGKDEPKLTPMADAVQVDLWSYQDKMLQSAKNGPAKFIRACIHPRDGKVILLNNAYETFKGVMVGDYAIVEKDLDAIYGDRFWEKKESNDSAFLLNLQNEKRLLLTTAKGFRSWISPGGSYVVYFDLKDACNYYSIDVQTGKRVIISKGIPAWTLGWQNDYGDGQKYPQQEVGVSAWLPNDAGVLVYDNYDIWQLDLSGKNPPVNITNGYGRRNQLIFSIVRTGESGQSGYSHIPTVSLKTSLLLKSFNRSSKQYGVYKKVLGTGIDPERLYSGDFELSLVPISDSNVPGDVPEARSVKAMGAQKWIVKRESASEAPSYFLTSDFKTYQRLTNIQPQKDYNWLTAELHSFKQLDGRTSQGILYKPENFDPTKKYPVIINFYAGLTKSLNHYQTPGYLTSPSFFEDGGPAWFVSHGYLVFLPDVLDSYFGANGKPAFNTVEGAARYLQSLPFVDGKYLAASGHSHSGLPAYYILTHSNTFAAMSIGASGTDLVSNSFSLRFGYSGESPSGWAEVGLGNFWQNQEKWLAESPFMHVDKVTTPVLMMHNKQDVSVAQTVEMFLALRRLGKRAWWLQYDNEYHTIGKLNDRKDFTIRSTQFYDHYLKGAPAPRWMLEGIPGKLKGVESRYELEP